MHLQHHISTLKSPDERYLMKWCIRKDGFKLTLFSMCYFYYNVTKCYTRGIKSHTFLFNVTACTICSEGENTTLLLRRCVRDIC